MSKNDDALRCAEAIDSTHWPEREVAAHIRRLVAENEAQAALLRQAVGLIEGEYNHLPEAKTRALIAAIRQHLEGNT